MSEAQIALQTGRRVYRRTRDARHGSLCGETRRRESPRESRRAVSPGREFGRVGRGDRHPLRKMTMPCDNCVSRREFLATASGAAGLLALSGCGDGFLANPRPQIALPAGPVVITVASFPALSTAD